MLRRNRTVLFVLTALLAISVMLTGLANAATQREYVVSLIQSAGMRDEMISTSSNDQYNLDVDALAKSLGFLNNWDYNPAATVTDQVKANMDVAMEGAYNGLRDALSKKPMAPYFVNGMAQPIFYYGNHNVIDTSGEGVIRFVVYVETDLDTDGDGKLDLVKALVQLPRAALDGAKFSTVFEARPYIAGRNGSGNVPSGAQTLGDTYLAANPNYKHEDLYAIAAPRVPTGEASTADMAKNADYHSWYYIYTFNSAGIGSASVAYDTGNEELFEDLNWYDYFLVRGFAVVSSAGIGTYDSEGFATATADVEINSLKCVIEWIAGDRRAFTDRTSNIEIKANWSNGNVGTTGRSYAANTQFGLATTGVKGLKTVVPVAGIASYYDYCNGQGMGTRGVYCPTIAWLVNSSHANPEYMNDKYAGYSQLMRRQETALNNSYGAFWERRDYTRDGWFRDWGPSSIKSSMLIVHGANDDNVKPKQSIMMNEAAKVNGVDVRWIWHQGDHMTPTYPRASPTATDATRPFTMYCGDYTYDEWLNMWFSHYLYDLDNGVTKLIPGVLAQDNGGDWILYDSLGLDSRKSIIMNDTHRVSSSTPFSAMSVYETPGYYGEEDDAPTHADEGIIMPVVAAATPSDASTTLINSANGSSSWQNFLDGPTAGSSVYHFNLTEDVTVKGVVKVNLRAAISSVDSNVGSIVRAHVKLVEIAAPGTTLKYYGNAAMGSSPGYTMIQREGYWQGGGIEPTNLRHNLVEFTQRTTGTYREIAKGWINLCNPKAGFDGYTADIKDRIDPKDNIDVYHDYEIFMQPCVHTAKAGNKLALIITTGNNAATAAHTGNNAFTFTIDNDATNAEIPIATPVIFLSPVSEPKITITEGDTATLTVDPSVTMLKGATFSYQWYSNTTNSNEGGVIIPGATGSSYTIPPTLDPGTYYYFCEVSVSGAEALRSGAWTVIVTKDDDRHDWKFRGCNVGFFTLLLLAVPFFARKRW